MTEMTEIRALIDAERYDEALERLDAAIAGRETEALYLMRGRLLWRLGRRGAAITDYEYAEALNPGGSASTLLEQARDVLDFFNPDLLNP